MVVIEGAGTCNSSIKTSNMKMILNDFIQTKVRKQAQSEQQSMSHNATKVHTKLFDLFLDELKMCSLHWTRG